MRLVYIDESGDHNLKKISDKYQILCVSACIFNNADINDLDSRFNSLKQKYFKTRNVIFVSRKIRKHLDEFSILNDSSKRAEFYFDLDNLISELKFNILSVVILKQEHLSQYGCHARNPYDLSLEFIMERLILNFGCSEEINIIAESRGRKEDSELKAAFRNMKMNHGNQYKYNFDSIKGLWTEKKEKNINGLQIADLCAYPIGYKVLHPQEESLAFNILFPRIISCRNVDHSHILGCGLKIFPHPSDIHIRIWG